MPWKGAGRWISLVGAGLLVSSSGALILMVVLLRRPTAELAGAIGFDFFLGILVFATVYRGNKHAPRLVIVLAILMTVRVVLGTVLDWTEIGILFNTLLSLMFIVAAYDLLRQVKSFRQQGAATASSENGERDR